MAQWVFSSLLLTAAVLIARYARSCMKAVHLKNRFHSLPSFCMIWSRQAVKVDEMLDPILPFKAAPVTWRTAGMASLPRYAAQRLVRIWRSHPQPGGRRTGEQARPGTSGTNGPRRRE